MSKINNNKNKKKGYSITRKKHNKKNKVKKKIISKKKNFKGGMMLINKPISVPEPEVGKYNPINKYILGTYKDTDILDIITREIKYTFNINQVNDDDIIEDDFNDNMLGGYNFYKKTKSMKKNLKLKTRRTHRGGTPNTPGTLYKTYYVTPSETETYSYNNDRNITEETLQTIFQNLGMGIYKDDIDNDFIHDFSNSSLENKDLEDKFNLLIDDYNKLMKFIPIDLNKKNIYGKDYDLITNEVDNAISIIDAGKFTIGGYGIQKKDNGKQNYSSHFSNSVDSASTGKKCPEIPYLLKDILNEVKKLRGGDFPEIFSKCLSNFIKGICLDNKDRETSTTILLDNVEFSFVEKGKNIILQYYKSIIKKTITTNISFEWKVSQASIANTINLLEPNLTIPRSTKKMDIDTITKIKILTDSDKKITIDVLKNMKYIGDKSHIVQAILYILLLKSGKNDDSPKVVIKTLDRMLFKCICLVIVRAMELSKENFKPNKDYYEKISKNLGAMYGCQFQVAQVFKKSINEGKLYKQYYNRINSSSFPSSNILGEYGLFSNFGDKFKYITNVIVNIYKEFNKELTGNEKNIFDTVNIHYRVYELYKVKFNINRFIDLYTYIPENVDEIKFPYIDENREIQDISLFKNKDMENIETFIKTEEEWKKACNYNLDTLKIHYNNLLSNLKNLEETKVYKLYLYNKTYLMFFKQTESIYNNIIPITPFNKLQSESFDYIFPSLYGDIYVQLNKELKTGKRGYYSNGLFDSRMEVPNKNLVKCFPFFKIINSYTENKYKLINPNDNKTFNDSNIIFAKRGIIFEKCSYINNILRDSKYYKFYSKTIQLIQDQMPSFIYFLINYVKNLKNFKEYYEAIKKNLVLPYSIDLKFNGNIQNIYLEEYFRVCYGNLNILFEEYYIESYILGIPLIYFINHGDGLRCNYNLENDLIPLKIEPILNQSSKPKLLEDYFDDLQKLEINKNSMERNPKIRRIHKKNNISSIPKKFLNFTSTGENISVGNFQVLNITNNDYKKNIRNLLESVRNLYKESIEISNIYNI